MDHRTDLDARLARLEKQNHRLRRGMGLAVVCLCAAALMGAHHAKKDATFGTITADSIRLVDSAGNAVILIGKGEVGTGMAVLQSDGSPAAIVGKSNAEEAGGFVVFDAAGNARIGIGMDEGVPSLAIADVDGTKRLSLGGGNQKFGVAVFDEMEKPRAAIGMVESKPVLFLDEDGN